MAVNDQATVKNSQQVPFIVRAGGPDAATASAHLAAKMALINGVVQKVTQSSTLDAAGFAAAGAGAGTSFELTLQKGADTTTARTEVIVNGAGGLGLATDPATIDVNNADIAAYAAAYRDAQGTGGYSAVRGHYFKS